METKESLIKLLELVKENILNGNCDNNLDFTMETLITLLSPEATFSLAQAAQYLNISERTLRRYIDQGIIGLPKKEVGKRKYYTKEQLDLVKK